MNIGIVVSTSEVSIDDKVISEHIIYVVLDHLAHPCAKIFFDAKQMMRRMQAIYMAAAFIVDGRRYVQ